MTATTRESLENELNDINKELNHFPTSDVRAKLLYVRRAQIHVILGHGKPSERSQDQPESATIFQEVTNNLAKLLVIKEKNYGQSFNRAGDILRIMAPDGIKPDQYDDVLTVVRIIDKLFRVMKGAPDEESPYHDIAGYSILKLVKDYKQTPDQDQ